MEKFIEINGFEGRYAISNKGNLMNLKNGKILKPSIGTTGYYGFGVTIAPYKLKRLIIHRLVALHFIDNPYNKTDVNHKDGNKLNNNVENLEWMTRSENIKHAYDNKLNIASPSYGENNGMSKITKDIALLIRSRFENGERQKDISKSLNLSKYLINQVIKRRTWKHI